MNNSFSGVRWSAFELLHGANYFSDKKNEMWRGNTGCVASPPQYLMNITCEYNLVQ